MEYINNSPMLSVGDVASELERLSSLCHVITQFQDNPAMDTIALKDVGCVMGILRDCLDQQVEVLNSIKWSAEKAVDA